MADNGTCIYKYNAHELYVNPPWGDTCGRTTYTLEGKDTPDPWCPEHGGTADSTPVTNPTTE